MAIPRRTSTVSLPYRDPIATDTLLAFLGRRAIAGVEEIQGDTYRRAVRSRDGRPVIVDVRPRSDGTITLDAEAGGGTDLDEVAASARAALDLDADPAVIDGVLAADPALAPLVARLPGIRVPGAFDAFELVARAIFGQQVSVAGARTSLGRFARRFGTPLDAPSGGITHLFPTPERVAEIRIDGYGIPRGRAETIRRVAELFAAGAIDLSNSASDGAALRVLSSIRGIGPWTLSYVAMRALRDPDAFPATDLGVRRGFEALGLPATPPAIVERAERWRPWRAYAAMHLWHAHACAPRPGRSETRPGISSLASPET